MITKFNYGQWHDESDVGLGWGFPSLQLHYANKKIILDDFPNSSKEITVEQALDFVEIFAEQFFENEPEDIADSIINFEIDYLMTA
ncbi:MAG: hypothetical protein WCK67_08010 [bacterium]